MPVRQQVGHVFLRVLDAGAVGRPIDGLVAPQQFLQRRHVVGHVAVRLRDYRGGPAHHLVAAEQDAFLAKRKAQMVGGVARRVHRLDGPVLAFDDVAVLDGDIRAEIEIRAFLDLRHVAVAAMRAVSVARRRSRAGTGAPPANGRDGCG